MSPLLCRFSDAGEDELTTRHGGRKPPMHEIAEVGHPAVPRTTMGIWRRAEPRGTPTEVLGLLRLYRTVRVRMLAKEWKADWSRGRRQRWGASRAPAMSAGIAG